MTKFWQGFTMVVNEKIFESINKLSISSKNFLIFYIRGSWATLDRVATEQGKQGKQGIWFLLFPDRENTGNFAVTQGKFLKHRENIFDCIYHCKKHVSLHIFSIYFSLALLGILSSFRWLFLVLFLPVYQYIYCPITFPYHMVTKYQPNFLGAVLKANIISNVYIWEFF